MEPLRGGWSVADGRPVPASGYEIKFGHGLLHRESSSWPRYVAVTTPSAYAAALPFLARDPEAVGYVTRLDWAHLDQVTESLPSDAELVVGLGGGMAIDASKYVALRKGLPLVLAPTLVSTGAIIHGNVARWEGRRIIGGKDTWPWKDFGAILVDYDVVLEAPDHLNTAGLGDVLCGFSGIAEWTHNARLGIGAAFSKPAVAATAEHHNHIVTQFPKTLSRKGALTPESVRFIMTAIQERDAKSLRHPAAVGADHTLWMAMEEVNDRGYVHGEMVALAAVIIAWRCGESPDTLPGWLDVCRVRRLPGEMGLEKAELRRGLEIAPAYISDRAADGTTPSILSRDPISGKSFDELWDFLETAQDHQNR